MGRSWDPEFSAYFAARGRALRRTAYLLCGNWHEAEDLVATAFVRLYPRWAKVRDGNLDAYVRRIVVNVYLTSRKRRSSGEIPVAEPPDHPAPDHPPEDRMVLDGFLATLPPRQRAMVVLRYWEDLSIGETAELLGVAEGTVKSQTARAVHALRGLVDGSRAWHAGASSGAGTGKDVTTHG